MYYDKIGRLIKQASTAVICSLLLIGCNGSSDKTSSESNEESLQVSETPIFPQGEKGSSEFFTGNAYNYSLLPIDSTYTTLIGNVYFEPGARSNWHTHPGGQVLIITGGVGYHQIDGEPIEVLHKGDVVTCPPNIRHWHGAGPEEPLHQLYIVPNTEKGIVNWMEAVTDEQYNDVDNEAL